MFSKPNPCKLTGFEVHVTDNPCWQAPILLYPEPDKGETGTEMGKLKLRRNPMVALSPTYAKSYMPWTGHTVEGYCKFGSCLTNIKLAPLNDVQEWAAAVTYT